MSVYDQTSGVTYATLSSAITGSASGDVLQVTAGSYVENFPIITHSLTIEAVGGLVSLSNPQPIPLNDKGVLDVGLDSGSSLTISGLEISGAQADPDSNNGAGIRFEGGNGTLTVVNSYIHGNQNGILTGATDAASPSGGMVVVISNSEIADNGLDPSNPAYGFAHNIYVGAVTRLSITDSYIHGALGGSEIKSRAATNDISDNRIQDGPTAGSTYDIDLPDGGVDTVTGNTLEKGNAAPNRHMIHFGGEGTYANSSLAVSNNVFINDPADLSDPNTAAVAVLNQTQTTAGASVPAVITGNTLYHIGADNLFEDANAPSDSAASNSFIAGASPALDTSSNFTTACFAGGTEIATLRGPVRVEALAVGDRAVLAGGGSRPIVWIGHRRLRCSAHPQPDCIWPVRVAAHALGDLMPARDLLLSPEHAVFTHGVLVPAQDLINGTTICQIRTEFVDYWHVELDSHDVILAEGLPVESFLENGNRCDFEAIPVLALHPMFAGSDGGEAPCAPIVRQGPVLEQVRREIDQRSAQGGAARRVHSFG